MSDFKIIKCKKCDANLVEMAGHRLTRCEQCGYNFSQLKTPARRVRKNAHRSAIQQKQATTPELQDIINKLKGFKTKVESKTSPPSSATHTQSKSKKKIPLVKKKKSNIIGTLIFYVILFNVLRAIFGF